MDSHINSIQHPLDRLLRLAGSALIVIALILTIWPAGRPSPSDVSASRAGRSRGWWSYANGDEILALALDGDRLWAGTQAGGAVHWDPAQGTYIQYLYPQTGLACNDVRDVLVDGTGRIWFATCRGVSVLRPADRSWQTYTVASTDGRLPSDNVTALAADAAGNVWVGTAQTWDGRRFVGGGLAHWERATGEWRAFIPPTSPAVVDVVVDGQGRVWAATQPYVTWVPPTNDQEGHWAHRGGGLAMWDGSQWQTYDSASDLADSVLAVAVDTAGNVWVGTEGAGAFVFTTTGRYRFGTADGLADNYVQAIGFGPGGEVWLATRKFNGYGTGVSILNPGASLSDKSDDVWRQYTSDDGLPADLVRAIVSDGTGVWLGIGDPKAIGHGISRFEPGTGFQPPLLTRMTNLSDNHMTALAQAPDGRLWVGTRYGGVSVLATDRRTWTTYTRGNTDDDGQPPWTGLRGNSVTGIAFDSAGRVWIGTRQTTYNRALRGFEDGGLSVFDPALGQWTSRTQRNTDDNGREPWRGLQSDDVSAVAVDWDDRVWVGTGNLRNFTGAGISLLDFGASPFTTTDDTWTHYDIYDRLPSNNITGIVIDGARRQIWVSAAPHWANAARVGGGVGRFDGNRWIKWNNDSGLVAADNEVHTIALAPDGVVWAGAWTYQGSFHWPSGIGIDAVVSRFDGNVWQQAGLFEDDGYVGALTIGDDGSVWAGTSKNALGETPATGGVKLLSGGQWVAITTENSGIVENEIQVITQSTDGDLWLGSLDHGLSRYSQQAPAEPTATPSPPGPTVGPTATPTLEPTVDVSRLIWRRMFPLALRNYIGLEAPPTPSSTPTALPPTSTPTSLASPTAGPSVTPALPTPSLTPTASATPARTSTPTSSATPTRTPTPTRSIPTPMPSPTLKPPPLGVWIPVLGVPPADLYDVFFIDRDVGWAVGDRGVILHSENGGATWTFQTSRTDRLLSSAFFLDRSTGWIVGDDGLILGTTDSGTTWRPAISPVTEDLTAVALRSPTDGWILGHDGAVLRWNGSRWLRQAQTSYHFTSVYLLESDQGWATTAEEGQNAGRVMRLVEGQWMPAETFQALYDIHVPASGQGWAVGDRGTAVRQMQNRWEYVSRPPTGGQALRAVYSLGNGQAWAMGDQGMIFFFNGERWENRTDPRLTRHTIHAIHMTPDGRRGWAVGEAGISGATILRYVTEDTSLGRWLMADH